MFEPMEISVTPRLVRVFCDESRQNAAHFMLLGSIWVFDNYIEEFERACFTLRKDRNLFGHIKWVKVSKKHLENYRDFLGIFFEAMRRGRTSFRCLEVDTRLYPLNCELNQGDAELGFYKCYYQLLFHGLKPENRYHITLAARTDRVQTRLNTLAEVLDRGAKKRYKTKHTLVTALEAKPARNENAIQMADLLIGALGYELEGWREREGSKQPKKDLCDYIRRQIRWPNLCLSTPPWEERFNVWRFRSSRAEIKRRPGS